MGLDAIDMFSATLTLVALYLDPWLCSIITT